MKNDFLNAILKSHNNYCQKISLIDNTQKKLLANYLEIFDQETFIYFSQEKNNYFITIYDHENKNFLIIQEPQDQDKIINHCWLIKNKNKLICKFSLNENNNNILDVDYNLLKVIDNEKKIKVNINNRKIKNILGKIKKFEVNKKIPEKQKLLINDFFSLLEKNMINKIINHQNNKKSLKI